MALAHGNTGQSADPGGIWPRPATDSTETPTTFGLSGNDGIELGLAALGFIRTTGLDAFDVLRQTLTRGRQVPGTHLLSCFVGFEISSKPSMNLENSEGFAYVR